MADTPSTPSTPLENTLTDELVQQAPANNAITEDFSTLEEPAPEAEGRSTTIPLPELGTQMLAVLEPGTLVGGRYQVQALLSSTPESNIYAVVDQQGYVHCWACGSTSSEEGDTYCVECGAQLTGRHYRLQEFRLSPQPPAEGSNPLPVPEPILKNEVQGVAHVYNTLVDVNARRGCVVWEAVPGSSLNAMAEGAANMALTTASGSLDGIDEERAVVWMAQAAEVLARLHHAGLVGCAMNSDNLVIQPGDRVALIDPSSCRAVDPDSKQEPSEQALDVHRLAVELERWFMSVRTLGGAPGEVSVGADEGRAVAGADEITEPLGTNSNLALVLTKAREVGYSSAEEFLHDLEKLTDAGVPANLIIQSGRASDLGLVRQINEDSILTIEAVVLEHQGHLPVGLYVVADGMGGHANGEVASAVAVRTIGGLVNSALIGPLLAGESTPHDPTTCAGLLRQAVLEANRRITSLAGERKSDLGTTTVAALLIGNHVTIANVGDSRAYLWNEGQVTPLTQDHSLVAQLVAAGQIEPEEMYTHPRRNEIFRALGDARLTDLEVDIYHHRLAPDAGLLLCSDGLWDYVRDPAISSTISGTLREGPQQVCQALINQANVAGGDDNISAIFVTVSAPGA